jgi:hypothetical protein
LWKSLLQGCDHMPARSSLHLVPRLAHCVHCADNAGHLQPLVPDVLYTRSRQHHPQGACWLPRHPQFSKFFLLPSSSLGESQTLKLERCARFAPTRLMWPQPYAAAALLYHTWPPWERSCSTEQSASGRTTPRAGRAQQELHRAILLQAPHVYGLLLCVLRGGCCLLLSLCCGQVIDCSSSNMCLLHDREACWHGQSGSD